MRGSPFAMSPRTRSAGARGFAFWIRFRSSYTCGSSRGRSGRLAARNISFAAFSMSLEPRRLLSRALAFLSEQRSERYLNAASKSASSSFSLHFSFDLLNGGSLHVSAPTPPARSLALPAILRHCSRLSGAHLSDARLSAIHSRPTPKAIDQAARTAGDQSQGTGDEKPQQRPLIGLRREHHRPEEPAAESNRADDPRPGRRSFEHARRSDLHAMPNQPGDRSGRQKRGACRQPRQILRNDLNKHEPVGRQVNGRKDHDGNERLPDNVHADLSPSAEGTPLQRANGGSLNFWGKLVKRPPPRPPPPRGRRQAW